MCNFFFFFNQFLIYYPKLTARNAILGVTLGFHIFTPLCVCFFLFLVVVFCCFFALSIVSILFFDLKKNEMK